MSPEQLKDKIRTAFNQFSPEHPEILADFYSSEAVFQDPVTRVEGLANIRTYYEHVYKSVQSIQFTFSQIANSGSTYYAHWNMELKVRGLNSGQGYSVEGMSVLVFGENGKVISHRDYLDLGAMVYEQIPILGHGIRAIKRMLHS